jgi:hypothetical protein
VTYPAPINLTDADAVVEALRAGSEANRGALCRRGSIDVIEGQGRLIATGDLHDNPIHFAKVVEAANLEIAPGSDVERPPAHLVLHELIHGDRLMNGLDMSYRVLVRAAMIKAAYPEHVHILLANHELSQIAGAGIVKDGVRVVEAFNKGVEYVFGEGTDGVLAAIGDFVRSMPLALRCRSRMGDILCAHSLPSAAMMSRFDPTILTRDLTEEDYQPRTGSAYIMVWGRGYDADLLEDLVERWGINLFILGHEKVDEGAMVVEPNAVVLNSDHERGVYLPIDLEKPPRAREALGMVQRLGA